MAGTLHIFRRSDSPLTYQANYTLGPVSWVQVFDPAGLEHFLHLGSGLSRPTADAILAELRDAGHSTEAPVEIAELHLAEMGFAESPSED
jgi:hypothetical protein